MEILKFYSDSCAPCKALSSFLESKGYNTTEVNLDESSELAVKYNIRGVPTLIKTEDGQEVERVTGFSASVTDKVEALFNV